MGDVFDQVATKPSGDVFDQVAAAQKPQQNFVGPGATPKLVASVGKTQQDAVPSNHPAYYGFTPGNVLSNAVAGAKGLVVGGYQLGKDLLSNPNWFSGPDSTAQKFVYGPSEQETQKAGADLASGNKVGAYGHVLASAVPLVGPWAAALGEQAGTGDVGGATGQAAGTFGAASAIPKVAAGVKSGARGAVAALSEARNTGPLAPMDKLIGTTPERISELRSFPEKVEDVRQRVSELEAKVHEAASSQFPKVPGKVVIDRTVNTEPTGLLDERGQPITRDVVHETTQNFQQLQEARSKLIQDINNEKLAVDRGAAPRFDLRDMYTRLQTIDGYMDKLASAAGKADQLAAARRAYGDYMRDFHSSKSPLRGVINAAPGESFSVIRQFLNPDQGARALEMLRKYGASDVADNIRELTGQGRKAAMIDANEAAKLRAAGSEAAYRYQRLEESLRQTRFNELPSGAEARLPAAATRSTLPSAVKEIPGANVVSPRRVTEYRIKRELGQ